MKFSKIILFSIVLTFLACSTPTTAATQNFSSEKAGPEVAVSIHAPLDRPRVGEKLKFAVSWMGIPVGYGSLEVKEKLIVNGREAYHVVALAGTNEFLSKLYPVHDEIHSIFDAEDFRSYKFTKTLKEGRYRADEKIIFDHAAKKGHYESFLNKGKKTVDITQGTMDLVSAFYWFRSQSVKVGDQAKTTVASEEKAWRTEFWVLKLQKKIIRNKGAYHTLVVEPKTRLKGILYDRGQAWVYFTVDETRTPIWITLKTPFGPVVGVLKKFGGENKGLCLSSGILSS